MRFTLGAFNRILYQVPLDALKLVNSFMNRRFKFMPNGNSQFIWKERPSLDIFFSEIGVTLTKFAEDHNLRIDKYWHQFPSWRLSLNIQKVVWHV
jgi:hypothetical protein